MTVDFEFIIPEGLDLGEVQARLQHGLRLEPEPIAVVRRTCFDSFDWRVHGNAAVLEGISDGKHYRLIWRPLSAGKRRENRSASTRPPALYGTCRRVACVTVSMRSWRCASWYRWSRSAPGFTPCAC